ncbi:hypothetical protein TNCV_3899661 [Trichonephila clavipes]|nr:hypothetical protein TNCV_3899661 [Trichonephila clavipes]
MSRAYGIDGHGFCLWDMSHFRAICQCPYRMARTWLLDHLTLSLPIPTDYVISQVSFESNALEEVVGIFSDMAAEWSGLVSSSAKPVEVYSQKVMSSNYAKAGPKRDWTYFGQSFSWLSKTLRFLGHGSIFVNVCEDNALCSSEGQGDFRLSRFVSLLDF